MRGLSAAGLVVIVSAIVGTSAPAAAYPYFRTTSGTDTCGACHVAPSGGGPLTAWGRDETGETLARGGDGAFLHGLVALPSWLDVGGDLRLAALINDVGNVNGAEAAVFPMQAQLAVHVEGGAWHVVADAGLLGAVRADAIAVEGLGPAPAAPWLVSSAHYVMWRPDERGAYARAGKFATPFGLRLADHTAYVRRRLGFGLYEEPYALSGGYLGERWDVHATAFVSDPWRGSPERDVGGAVLAERRQGAGVASVSAQVAQRADDRRVRGGASASWWAAAAAVYALAEIDGGLQTLANDTRAQITGYGGLAWLPVRGVIVGGAYEVDDADLGRDGDTRHAFDLWSTFMPIAHVEVGLSSRYQWIGPEGRAAMILLQLHYFL